MDSLLPTSKCTTIHRTELVDEMGRTLVIAGGYQGSVYGYYVCKETVDSELNQTHHSDFVYFSPNVSQQSYQQALTFMRDFAAGEKR